MSSFTKGTDELDGVSHGSRSRAETSESAISNSSVEGGSMKSRESHDDSENRKGTKKRKSLTSRFRSVFSYLTGKSPSPAPPADKVRTDSIGGDVPQMLPLLEDPELIGKCDYGTLTLNVKMALALRPHLPETVQIQAFKLAYSLYNDGTELTTFYKNARGLDYTLLLIETIDGNVFGGFCSREWKPVGSYFGTGESFIFSIRKHRDCNERKSSNEEEEKETTSYTSVVHKWTTLNNYFCFADHDKIAMGGGGGGFGFVIDEDFGSCDSNACETYGNVRSLDAAKNDDCKGGHGGSPVSRIANIELWGFQL